MLFLVYGLPGAVPSQQPWDEHVSQAAAGITARHIDLPLQDATMAEIVIEYVNKVVTSLKFPPFC
jgi:hypothetical protein